MSDVTKQELQNKLEQARKDAATVEANVKQLEKEIQEFDFPKPRCGDVVEWCSSQITLGATGTRRIVLKQGGREPFFQLRDVNGFIVTHLSSAILGTYYKNGSYKLLYNIFD
jgi:hypothetical protein